MQTQTPTTIEFLSDLRNRGVQVSLNKDRLRCNAPEGVLTPTLRQQIAERKGEILEFLQNVGSGVQLPAIVPAPMERHLPFPLTDVQEAYWVGRGAVFELGNVSTHLYWEIESGPLDLDRLGDAWRKVVTRHEMLRAIIQPDGRQRILDDTPPYKIALLDLREHNEQTQATELENVRRTMSHQVFIADVWPLFEIRVSQLDHERFRLHISFDLLIADVWSMSFFFEEWSRCYRDPTLILPALDLSFRDYVLAETALQSTEFYRNARAYWLERLDTLPPAPELPVLADSESLKKPHFRRRSFQLQRADWLRIKQRAAQSGLTPSGVLLAAFAEVLTAFSKNPTFTINLNLFNRLPLHAEVNKIVGDFTTLSLLAVDNSARDSFTDRALRLQRQMWRDMDHRYFSGVRVLRELARRQTATRRAAMPIVFTSALGWDARDEQSEMFSQFGRVSYAISQTPQVWLDHQVLEQGGGAVLIWDAVENIFPPGLLDDMFAVYRALLEQLSAGEDAWVATTGCLTPPAQLELVAAANSTTAPVTDDLLHSGFLRQVQLQKDAPAVITTTQTLSYGTLHANALNTARRLQAANNDPGAFIAVVLEKGWEQIVAVYAVLYAGAAYLPIDPALPTERRFYLLESSSVKLALTSAAHDTKLDWPDSVQRVCINDITEPSSSADSLANATTCEDLAYMIYTSGSSGAPKGVLIDHRGAVNTIRDVNARFDVGPSDRVLSLSALNFDLSVYDIFGVLAAGGALVLPEPALLKDPAHWTELLCKHRVTLWNTVPALLSMLTEYLSETAAQATTLRLALLSGDWLPLALPERARALWPQLKLVSLGGATEASIWSIFYIVEQTAADWKSIPYGKPLANQRFYVLDAALEQRPVWTPGELYIGGLGLALGYFRDEAKTNAAFIKHPRTGERLYRTGDLGRYLPDGNIEFLGREDFQVKVGGYRIELGEIEAALLQDQAVTQAVVVAHGEREQKQLAAYVTVETALAKIEFKTKQPGIRALAPNETLTRLPKLEFDESLRQKFLKRQSYRFFLDEPIEPELFGAFLGCLAQMPVADAVFPKYRYPSSGSLNPVRTYLYLKPNRVRGLAGGVYYYNPAEHGLALVNADAVVTPEMHVGGNGAVFERAAFSLFLVGALEILTPLYGDFARDLCLLEAGYMGQLLMEAGVEHAIGLCPIGYMKFDGLREAFGLEPTQVLLQSFEGGAIVVEQMLRWGAEEPATQASSTQTSPAQTLESRLQEHLRAKLPEYMVPPVILRIDTLPLTANGKVDRRALPDPSGASMGASAEGTPPETEMEKLVAEIVLGILEKQELNVFSNFFDLGANSVHIVQIHRKLREATGRDLPIVDMFRFPTVGYLAKHLSQGKEEKPVFDKIAQRAAKRKARRR